MSKVRIPVEAHFGRTTKKSGTLIVDRASRTISVRERFGREEFTLPLDEVADFIAYKALQAKAMELQTTRRRRVRKVSRGLLTTGR